MFSKDCAKVLSLVATAGLVGLAFGGEAAASPVPFYSASCNASAWFYTDACDGTSFPQQDAAVSFDWGDDEVDASAAVNMRLDPGNVGLRVAALAFTIDQFAAWAVATGTVGWAESLTVTGASFGDPVLLRLYNTLGYSASSASSSGGPLSIIQTSSSISTSASFTVTRLLGGTDSYVDNYSPASVSTGNVEHEGNFLVESYVGATIYLSYLLHAQCAVYVEQPTMNLGTLTSADCVIDAGHSGHTYVDALTPGAGILSESGHDYSSPASVPEPASLVLIGTGLATFTARRWRARWRPRAYGAASETQRAQ